ncbi:MAG: glycerol-3-phosphate dehydrogenase/oxidase [Chloroflexi bacterium]|nr:glycerol-3-phosphate dehydrogenase/oxidase [Chloroflexota bacterium]
MRPNGCAMSDNAAISTLDRERTLKALESEHFDLAIIGGGITGAGLARKAALSGLSVALLEAEDFASGTSSRSSKLIHGGLRYLAMGEVGLVRETALERKVIHRLAPHLAERRWMVLPLRSRAALLKYRAAVTFYEKLGAVDREDLHHNWSRRDLETEEPLLDRSRYPYACAFREYLTDDARLVLANLRAAAASGGRLLNYAPAGSIPVENGRAAGVDATCALTGRTVRVRASCVVNAAGPWVDAVRRMEEPDAPSQLHLSKGVHVVLPASRLPLHNILVMTTADGRSIFAIPQRDVVFIGTTDTTYEHGPQVWPGISAADVDYLLEPLPRYLSMDALSRSDVTAAWSGLRPLVAQRGKKPADISRSDEVLLSPAGVVTVAGGKLTGYRPTVERVLESIAQVLGRKLPDVDEPPLPGGDFDGDLARLARSLVEEFGISEGTGARLAKLYGCEAPAVVRLGAAPLAADAPLLSGEIDWGVTQEGAARLEDVIYRRTRAALYDPGARDRVVEPAARRMAEILGWNAERISDEVGRTRGRITADLTFGGTAT